MDMDKNVSLIVHAKGICYTAIVDGEQYDVLLGIKGDVSIKGSKGRWKRYPIAAFDGVLSGDTIKRFFREA